VKIGHYRCRINTVHIVKYCNLLLKGFAESTRSREHHMAYSREETQKLLMSFTEGAITEAQFRARLVEMNVPQSGIESMMDGARQFRAARLGSGPSSAAGSGVVWAIVLVLAAIVGYYFFFRQ
jgi:hypothetical protein